jgi:tetratricopeptide (TPR) repeat protein
MLLLQLLGEPVIVLGNQKVALRPREATLLAYLSEHTGVRFLGREVVASKFWPYAGTNRSLRSLSQLTYQLRSKVPELGLLPHPTHIIHGQLDSDVQRMRELARAGFYYEVLTLYHGRFLGGGLVGADEIDAWIEGVSGEVGSILEVALEHCSAHATTQSEKHLVRSVADALLADGTPSRAALIARVLSCLAEGDTRRASADYAKLRDEYDATPSFVELKRLAAMRDRSAPDTLNREVKFVGRHEELEALHNRWRATDIQGQLVLISGEPGIGKTRLVNQLLRRVAVSGGRIWLARCLAATKRVPYASLRELWNNHLEQYRASHAEAAESFSTIESALGGSASFAADVSDQTRYRLLDSILAVIESSSKLHPLAVFIDDIQWADDFTAQLLTLLALRIREQRLMLIAAMRTEEAEPAPEWIANELTPSCHLQLGQLSVESAGELVRSFEEANECTFSDVLRNRVLWQSAGRPLLILEGLVTAHSDSEHPLSTSGVYLPETAEALLRRRFRQLSPESHWLAGLLAVLGKPQDAFLIAEISGLVDSIAAGALEILCGRGILQFSAGKIGFSHDLMRETAYRQLAPATKVLLHRRAAELLSEAADEGVLAQHFAAAGDNEKAASHALCAAEHARKRGLYSDCEYYYELALRVGNSDDRVVAAQHYASHLAQVGRVGEIDQLLQHIKVEHQRAETSLLVNVVELESAFASGNAAMGDLVASARRVIAMSETIDSADLALALGALFDIAYDASSLEFGTEVARALCSASAKSARPLFKRQVDALVSIWEGTTLGYEHALARLGTCDVEGEDQSSILTSALTAFAKGTLLLLAGSLHEAKVVFDQSLTLAQSAGDLRRQTAAQVNSALVYMELGEFDNSRRRLEAAISSPNLGHRLRAYANLAILHYEEGADVLSLGAVHTLERANKLYGSDRYSNTAAAVAGLIAVRASEAEAILLRSNQLAHSEGTSDYLHGDLNYTVPFAAEALMIQGRIEEALATIEKAEVRVGCRDRICTLRLRLARAHILTRINKDKAFAVARRVEEEALRMGAALILRDARAVLDVVRV